MIKLVNIEIFGNNFGNAYHVANSNWQSIHDPINEDMLIDKTIVDDIVIQDNDEDVYYNGSKIISQTKVIEKIPQYTC